MIFGIFAFFGEDMFLGEEMEIYFKIWDMEHVWTGTPPSSFVLVNLIMMNTYDRHCEIMFCKIIFCRMRRIASGFWSTRVASWSLEYCDAPLHKSSPCTASPTLCTIVQTPACSRGYWVHFSKLPCISMH